jgi:hypothetical protein
MSQSQNFLFVELADTLLSADESEDGLTPGRPFAGLAIGDFVDRLGRPVKVVAKKLPAYLENTLKAIKAHQLKNMPGLPIDKEHSRGDALGWIVSAELGEVADSKGKIIPVIKMVARWTKVGAGLIKDKIMTNFSPTLDLERETIRGGGLTNYPASMDDNGIPLFEAIELSQGVTVLKQPEPEPVQPELISFAPVGLSTGAPSTASGTMSSPIYVTDPIPASDEEGDISDSGDETMAIQVTQEQLEELVGSRVKDALAQLDTQRQEAEPQGQTFELNQLVEAFGLNTETAVKERMQSLDQLADLIKKQANLEWQHRLAALQRENSYAELAQRVTGGTAEAPRGIPVDADVLKAELVKLAPEQAKFWGGLLEAAVSKGLNEYSELGHSKRVDVTELAEFYADLLDGWVNDGGTVKDFFFANPELGEMAQYNLSQYQEVK